jgi:hypothetical protein
MKPWKLILICCAAGLVCPLRAAPLFEDDSTLEIELEGPFWSLLENRQERNEWPFRLRTQAYEVDLQIKARGNSRMRICEFPPLRLNFNQDDTAGTPFAGQDKLKLVTRCKKASNSEADVLEEYAAYQIFGLFSEVGYRTRLVHIRYNDSDGRLKEKYADSFGFLVETQEQLAERVAGTLTGIAAVSLGQLDANQAALLYVFQYLIANTDWSFVAAENDENCCHNVDLYKIGPKLWPVPYDFDLAGLVNASYAFPDPSLKIKKVRMRQYRGFCTDTRVLRNALHTITSSKEEVLAVINDLPLLTEKQKAKQLAYLDQFFRKAEDEDKLIHSFEKSCHP